MNISLLDNSVFRDMLQRLWTKWKVYVRHYPNKSSWWDRYIKQQIKQTFQRQGASRNRDRKDTEDFCYAAIYHAIRSPLGTENIAITIRRLKAKILRLTCQYMRGVLLDTTDNDSMQGEDITTYHYIRSRKCKKHDK